MSSKFWFLALGIGVVAVMLFFLLKPRAVPPAGPAKLRFVSLAWQEETLAANRAIVAEWNAAHPEMQVEYVQGTWNAIHDYLITTFETGDVPDIFHYESSVIVDFALRGYLTDLAPMIDREMKNDILDVAWASVTRPNGEVCGIPFLMESFVGLYNADLLEQAGVAPPTFERPWSWSDLRMAAMKLTTPPAPDGASERYGAAIGLRNCANIIMNLSIGFDGSFFRNEKGRYVVQVGPHEKSLLTTLHQMLYTDHTLAPSSVGQSGAGMIPGFLARKYAMLIGIGAWGRQQLVQNAPPGFRWGVIPPLKAASQKTGTSTQTLSIPRASHHPAEAMQFIRFMTSTRNMARLARGDWMLPARASCLRLPEFQTDEGGWRTVTQSVAFLSKGPWLGAPGYVEWKSRVANPVLQEFFSDRIPLDEAARRIEEEGNVVLSRYQEEESR